MLWAGRRNDALVGRELLAAIVGVVAEVPTRFLILFSIFAPARCVKKGGKRKHFQDLQKLVLGCMDSYNSKKRRIFQRFSKVVKLLEGIWYEKNWI